MTVPVKVEPDEYVERARLAFENQEMARGFFRNYRGLAAAALAIGLAGIVVMWLVWLLAGPELNHNSTPPPPQPVVVRPAR
jgi:hypothetical protein